MTRYVLGVDPGGVTGLCLLDVDRRHFELVQTTPGLVLTIVSALLPTSVDVTLAIEKFVVGPRAGSSANPSAGATTRQLIGALVELGGSLGVRVVLRSAAEVKPWATNQRLVRAGLRVPTGMGHAGDAGRHATFEAVQSGGFPDPLSRNFRSPR